MFLVRIRAANGWDWRPWGGTSTAGKAGKNTMPFDGHTSRSHKLGSGDYTLEIKATNALHDPTTEMQINGKNLYSKKDSIA